MARKAGDTELEQEVRAEIDAFNEDREDPKARIRPDTLRRSEAARKAYEDNIINGVRFNKSLMSEIDGLNGRVKRSPRQEGITVRGD
jgi:hypothetical protein